MKRTRWIAWAWVALPLCARATETPPTITTVEFRGEDPALVFTFTADQPLRADAVELPVLRDPALILIRFNDVLVKRRWMKMRDRAVKRTLLHPSKDRPPGAILRMRMRAKVPPAVRENIRVEQRGPSVVVRIPRASKVADVAPVAAPVAAPAAPPAAPEVAPATPEPVLAVPTPEEEPAPTSEELEASPEAAEPPVAETPVEPPPVAETPVEPPPVAETPVEPPPAPASSEVAESPASASSPAPIMDVPSGMDALADGLGPSLDAKAGEGFARVAVMPFVTDDAPARDAWVGALSARMLSARLGRRPAVLPVGDGRSAEAMEILRETSRERLTPPQAASVGRLLGANALVVGEVTPDASSYVVSARLIDASSGRVLTRADSAFAGLALIKFSEARIEARSRAGAALRSAALPGWGQVYNGDDARGWIFGALFVSAVAGAGTFALLGRSAAADYDAFEPETVGRRDDANAHYTRANAFLVGAGVAWAVAIADAWISGEDVRTLRLRPGDGGTP